MGLLGPEPRCPGSAGWHGCALCWHLPALQPQVGVGGMDGEGVGRAGVDMWSVDGAGGALPSEPGWRPTETRDRQGLLRCGLHWVCSLNPWDLGVSPPADRGLPGAAQTPRPRGRACLRQTELRGGRERLEFRGSPALSTCPARSHLGPIVTGVQTRMPGSGRAKGGAASRPALASCRPASRRRVSWRPDRPPAGTVRFGPGPSAGG